MCNRHFSVKYLPCFVLSVVNLQIMPNFCVLGCKISGTTMHRFPDRFKFPERFKIWAALAGGKLASESDYERFQKMRICDLHFSDKDKNRNNRLNALAIPTLNLCGQFKGEVVQASTSTQQLQSSLPLPSKTEQFEHELLQASTSIQQPKTTLPPPSNTDNTCGIAVLNNVILEHNYVNIGSKPRRTSRKATPEENNNRGYWKQKLTHILHSTQFCGICLSTDELVDTVSDRFEIVVGGTRHSRTLADIIDVVFQETEDLLSNSQICSSCTQKLIQSYMFIQQARARSKMLKYHLNDLYLKTCYTRNNLVEVLPQEHDEVSNILISMENYDNLDQFQNNLYTKPPNKKVNRDRRRLKQSYKCLTCNLFLPSHKARRVHEVTNHRINVSKTQLNSRQHHGRILKRMCRICHKVVKNGELLKHLKEFHRDSLCPVCYVAFNSLEDLEAHKQTWHYSDVGKCFMCLKSYSEAELQQHQCWFSCNVCTEAPCVHHKYLTCYRQQILNGALRAKCLDCKFVCRTKRAYLEHVNMCHLKFSAESSVKSKVLPNN